MTTNTAENATAGVVRQRVLELAHTRMELDLAQWSDISNDFLRAADELDTARAEIERLRGLADRLTLEAQAHASEARTANSTIYEIYQVLSGSTGEPGNWNGAEPARQFVTAAQARIAELERGIGVLLATIGDFARPTGANGMTSLPETHPLVKASHDARATLSPAVKEPK